MAKIELYVNGVKIAEEEILLPSFSGMDYKHRTDSRIEFMNSKKMYMLIKYAEQVGFAHHYFIFTFESSMTEKDDGINLTPKK